MNKRELKEVLDYNPKTGIFKWKISPANQIEIGSIAGTKNKKGYIAIQIKGKIYGAHQLAYLFVYGYIPKEIDHKDRIRHHNWIKNLRKAFGSKNQRNKKISKNNKTGIKGVYYVEKRNKWQVTICIKYEHIFLGIFKNFNDAVLARYLAERKVNWHLSDQNSPAQEYCIEHATDRKTYLGYSKEKVYVVLNQLGILKQWLKKVMTGLL